WSFLEHFYCFPTGYTLHFSCPKHECSGELVLDKRDAEPKLYWATRRRGAPIPYLTRKHLNWQCPVCRQYFAEQELLIANRLPLMQETYRYLKDYEGEGWNQLRRFHPDDERLHGEHWKRVEATWKQREVQIEQERTQRKA